MHTYRRLAADHDPWLPNITDHRFNDAFDVAAWAELDRTIGWATWPEVWHLDGNGRFQCYFSGSSLDSIQRWADDPSSLYRPCREGLLGGSCPAQWLVVESRPVWLHAQPTVHEADAQAFIALRAELGRIGIRLVDAMVFDDRLHWWSLHELTSGTTRW